jgi:hypothetical protein
MALYLYYYSGATATDIKRWATPKSLQNMADAYTTASPFTLKLNNYASDGSGILPVTVTGGDKILYIDYTDSTHFELLGAGLVMDASGTDAPNNVKGVQTVTCAMPLKDLLRIMEYVPFSPDPTTGYPNDRARVLRLGVIAALPGWDWTSGISATLSVTYPVPPLGEPLTEYNFRSIQDILNDLATDPGQFGDTGYPVPTRRWWIGARLTDPTDPTLGITWVLHYLGAFDIAGAAYELKDRYDVSGVVEAGTKLYNTGAQWHIDSRNMIRDVYIAGPNTEPTLCTWQNPVNVAMGHGHISKIDGTDGTWDAGAISRKRITGGDWEATAIVQEFYLGHHQFQLDDSELIGPANTRQLTLNYYPAASRNTFGTRGWQAALIVRDATGVAVAVWDCRAATCILREHFTLNRQGQGMTFRLTDEDNFYRVENTGSDYALIKRQGGTETSLGTCGVSPLDGDQIKVFALGSQIQVYITRAGVPEGAYNLQVTGQTFNQHATKHGLYGNPAASGTSPQMRFYDFQCTTFFSDDAFGLTTVTAVTSWTDISYGFVKNNNGTLSLNEGGVVVATSDYSYNDKLRVSTMNYFDYSSASLIRMVRWDKLPMGESEWVTLHERTTGVVTLDATHPWYVAFAGSDLGATLNNISLRKEYANRFHADPAVFGTYAGVWPANGLIQSDELDTYIKRQTRADAIFRQSATPRISLNCELPPDLANPSVAPPFNLGERVLVSNRGAQWYNGSVDTRIYLFVTSIQRIETPGHLLSPGYRLTLEDRSFDTDLSGQRHLLKGTMATSKPDSRGVPAQSATDPTVFEWPDPTGDENFGDYMDVQLARVDSGAYANAQIGVQKIAPDATAVQLDKGQLVPGAQYVLRTRNMFNNGTASDWTESSPFVAPGQAPYNRPYSIGEWIGNGTDPIAAGSLDIIPVPESGEIQQWEVSSYDNSDPPVAAPGTIKFDVLHASADAFRQSGVSALTSIAGSDYPTLTTASYADSVKLTGWAKTVKAGDKLMFVVFASPTPTATKVMINLPIKRSDP